MKYIFHICIGLLLSCSLQATAQGSLNEGLIQYWTFDKHISYLNIVPDRGSNIHAEGKDGLAARKKGKRGTCYFFGAEAKTVLSVDQGLDLYDYFTIGGWLFPISLDVQQTLFHQFSNKTDRSYKIYIKDEELHFEYNDNRQSSGRYECKIGDFDMEEWNMFTITLEGNELKIFWNAQEIGSKKIKLNIRESQQNDRLYWGNSQDLNDPLFGGLDELFVYDRALTNYEIARMFAGTSPLPPKKEVEPVPVFKGRTVAFVDTIGIDLVNEQFLTFKIWDYQQVDNDSVAVYLNGENLCNVRLNSKGEAYEGNFKLQPNTSNVLLLYALNTGRLGDNTAEIKIKLGSKTFPPIKLSAKKDESEAIILNT
ncbi:MAG: LamG-like jellyroll fold domain-containing protein, partial [Bacteroidota bacterium]